MSAASDAVAAGPGALTESVRAACNDPADAIRMLYAPTTHPGVAATAHATPIGQASTRPRGPRPRFALSTGRARVPGADLRGLRADVLRRRGRDSRRRGRRARHGGTGRGRDGGDAATRLALRDLRTAVVDGLTTRGAQLPRLVVVARAASLPAPTPADQLHGDTTRADGLVARGPAAPGVHAARVRGPRGLTRAAPPLRTDFTPHG